MISNLLHGFFVTATDIGVGKNSVSAGIAAALTKSGINVGVMKPIGAGPPQTSGFKSKEAEKLAKAAGVSDSEDLINPVYLPVEASPYGGANLLQKPIDMELILKKFKELTSLHDLLLVEGIGGIMTPLTENSFVADMIKAMGFETIIVTPSTISTINHTVMTCRICKEYDLSIKGLVVNSSDKRQAVTENLAENLAKLTGAKILGIIPFMEKFDLNEMTSAVEKHIDLESLKPK